MVPALPLIAFKHYFASQLTKLDTLYHWPVRARTKQSLADFPWYKWETQSGGASECIALKKYLTQQWSISDDAGKKRLAHWIVADWGGVRSNREATLEAHWQQIHNAPQRWPLKGVASYSKILTLKDCTQYAIYDARVAACLNAIQWQLKPKNPVFFPYIPSQNKHFRRMPKHENFVTIFSKRKLINDWG